MRWAQVRTLTTANGNGIAKNKDIRTVLLGYVDSKLLLSQWNRHADTPLLSLDGLGSHLVFGLLLHA